MKLLPFAFPLKELAMRTFGLSYDQCYGSDEEKNTPTKIRPGVFGVDPGFYGEYLSARRVLQHLGVLMRDEFPGIWANAPVLSGALDHSDVVITPDVRFWDEAEAIEKEGGLLIRVDRVLAPVDDHESEHALDDFDGWDVVVQNDGTRTNMQNQAALIARALRW